MTSYKVKVNPEILIWAREDAGFELDDLPQYLDKVSLWESGDDKPTWPELRKLANKYKRPSVFFFRSKPPEKESDDLIDYRTTQEDNFNASPELRLEIRKAKYRRYAAIEVHKDMGMIIPSFSRYKFENKNYKVFAAKIREILGVSIETQKSWIIKLSNGERDQAHSRFLDEWKESVAELGILIFETENIKRTEISGLSLYKSKYPIILLNGKDTQNRRIFTLFHELTHLMLGESAICDLDKRNKKEAFCNKVAAEFLVPLKFLKEEEKVKKNKSLEWTSRQLGFLSNIYGVSKQTILLRLHSLKKTREEQFISLYNALEVDDEEKQEKKKKKSKNKKREGSMSPVNKKVKYDGKAYSRLIVSAYENNIISPVTFSRYLDLPVTDVGKLINNIY
ncbi:ImmA/IrrE family metallo-endopeptidase [Methanobacterium sp.]|jgi:Zn-dependent peptidase ImmA (M78 family)|uniref:ImmA/IrrE family metallo-endopeptidase n=1 Tax=Methanobacterium sp. TaxID=2164 RepID=UPI00315863C8